MLFQITSYLNFIWNSKNQHGVHSPFVFDLVTKCFYDKHKYPEYAILIDYRKSLLQNKNTIKVTDFGAGSKVFKGNTRAINQMAKTVGISPKRAELLFRLVNYFKPSTILELGTSLGLASSALSLGNKNAKIITLEGCANTQAIAKELFQVSGFRLPTNNIKFVTTEFRDFLNNLKPETWNLKPDLSESKLSQQTINLKPETSNLKPQFFNLIYFDGNHSKSATLDYFELLIPTSTNESVWIFDDIHWSTDMQAAWEIIKNHPKVTVTIDTYQWGIVFFRKEQEKEHFTIRV